MKQRYRITYLKTGSADRDRYLTVLAKDIAGAWKLAGRKVRGDLAKGERYSLLYIQDEAGKYLSF